MNTLPDSGLGRGKPSAREGTEKCLLEGNGTDLA